MKRIDVDEKSPLVLVIKSRIGVHKPTKAFRDKSKYVRKPKHKGKDE